MQSENWVVTCEAGSVTLCDLKNGGAITKRPIQAEAALMNPTVSILALRSGNTLQIFNLELKSKMNSHTMSSPCIFWKWLSQSTIALVTQTSVYHWKAVDSDSKVRGEERRQRDGQR